VNVYLPDELAAQPSSGSQPSGGPEEAVRQTLAAHSTDSWLSILPPASGHTVAHDRALHALDSAGGTGDPSWLRWSRASALVDLLLANDVGGAVRNRVPGHVLHAPSHLDATKQGWRLVTTDRRLHDVPAVDVVHA